MRILANEDKIKKSQHEFEEAVVKAVSEQIETEIGYPSGRRKASVKLPHFCGQFTAFESSHI